MDEEITHRNFIFLTTWWKPPWSFHPSTTPVLCWQTREGCVDLLLLQRLMKLLVDISCNERACVGHSHRSYCRIFSSALSGAGKSRIHLLQHLPLMAKPNSDVYGHTQPDGVLVQRWLSTSCLSLPAKMKYHLAARAARTKWQMLLLFFFPKISQSNKARRMWDH